ncbi:hypothetical protein [Niabella aurantiaca]|nr:hypothetical protein [Niabella aurantiaca]
MLKDLPGPGYQQLFQRIECLASIDLAYIQGAGQPAKFVEVQNFCIDE